MRLIRINLCFVIWIIVSLSQLKGIPEENIKIFKLKYGSVGFPGKPEYEYSPFETTGAVNMNFLSSIRPWTSTFNQKLTSFAKQKSTISDSKFDNEMTSNSALMRSKSEFFPTTDLPETTEPTNTNFSVENTSMSNQSGNVTITQSFETRTTRNTKSEVEILTRIDKRLPRKSLNDIIPDQPLENLILNNTKPSIKTPPQPTITPNLLNLLISQVTVQFQDITNATDSPLQLGAVSESVDAGLEPLSPQEIAHKTTSRKIANLIDHELIGPTIIPKGSNFPANLTSSDDKILENIVTGEINFAAGSFSNLSTSNDSVSTISDEMYATSNDSSPSTSFSDDNNTIEPAPTRDHTERIELYGYILHKHGYIILTAGCVAPVVVATLILVVLGWKRYKIRRQQQMQNSSPRLIRRYS